MSDTLFHLAALISTGAGATGLYLAAPRQQWLARPLPAWPGRAGGGGFLLSAWLLWCAVQHPATAFFTTLTVAMALFIALPVAAALAAATNRS